MDLISEIKNCDICRDPIVSVVYDGMTHLGPWAWMCESCFQIQGVGLGEGLGQKYVDKKKVAG